MVVATEMLEAQQSRTQAEGFYHQRHRLLRFTPYHID